GPAHVLTAKTVIAIARTIAKTDASLSGLRAMFASWRQIDVAEPDSRREIARHVGLTVARNRVLTNRKTLWRADHSQRQHDGGISDNLHPGRLAAMVVRLRAGPCRRPCLRAGSPSVQSAGGSYMTDATKPSSERSFFDRYVGLSESGSDVRTEFIPGITTFLTMVYIVFVNPQILGNAGMDKGAVFVATCIASAVSTTPIIRSRSRRAWGSMRSSRSPSCSLTNTPGSKRSPACSAPGCCSSSFPCSGSANTSSPRSRRISTWRSPPASDSFSASSRSKKQNRRRQPGDPGHARRSQAVAGDSLSRRLHRDRRAQLPHVGATLIGILAVTLIGL